MQGQQLYWFSFETEMSFEIYAYLTSLYKKYCTWDTLQWHVFDSWYKEVNNKSICIDKRTAKKTHNEVCSFLYDYFKNVPLQITELRLFADKYSGQNKNHALFRFLILLADAVWFEKLKFFFSCKGSFFFFCLAIGISQQ